MRCRLLIRIVVVLIVGPDLQGTWTNETITPFERPASMGDKAFLRSSST